MVFLPLFETKKEVGNHELFESHALYLSVIQIQKEPSAETAQVNIKVFTDDLHSALKNAFPDYTILKEDLICEEGEAFIETYFQKHFSCEINATRSQLTFQDCQIENEVFWLSFEMTCPKKWLNFKISADFFMELFPTQTNVLNLTNESEKRFCRMTKSESSCQTSFTNN